MLLKSKINKFPMFIFQTLIKLSHISLSLSYYEIVNEFKKVINIINGIIDLDKK